MTMLKLSFLFAICSLAACESPAAGFSKSVSSFASDFYQECIKVVPGNLIVSPYSVTSAIALLSQGAKGKTFEQIKSGLHLAGDQAQIADQYVSYYGQLQKGAGNSTLSIANQIYVQNGIKLNKNFQEVAVQKFVSGVEQIDFSKGTEAAQIINRFVEEKTQNKIKNFIQPGVIGPKSNVVLVNAIYLKAKWQSEFKKYDTRKGDFYISENEKVQVNFMNAKKTFNYGALADLDASALEIKYADSGFSFLALLPNIRTGLSALESKLKDYELSAITSKMEKQLVNVTIPKFKVESEVKLNEVLVKLGISDIFGNADLSGLIESGEPIAVSDVIHKAFIEVNEEGTEAAAVLGLTLIPTSLHVIPPTTPIFRADHPFIYYVLDSESNAVIFSGRITQFN